MPDSLFILLGMIVAFMATGWGIFRLSKGSIHFLPSFFWCVLMVFPFLLEFPLFYPDSRYLHAFGVFFFLALMVASDYVADRYVPLSDAHEPSKKLLHAAYGVAALYIGITVFHLSTLASIPFIDMVFGNADRHSLDAARNAFSRNYPVPALKYVFAIATPIIGMSSVFLFLANKRYVLAVLILLWAMIYCVTGTAKGPVIVVGVILFTGLIFLAQPRARLALTRSLLGLGVIALIGILAMAMGPGTVFGNLPAKYNKPQMLREDHPMLLGDYVRTSLESADCKGVICRKSDYLAYRVLLTPVEVSARWYEYFNAHPVTHVSFGRNIHDSHYDRDMHPAQSVGLWAFAEPIPNVYGDDAFAYASIDADAFGRYGMRGVLIVGFVFFALRLFSILFHDVSAPTRGIFYAISVGLFSALPASASLQALLLAHGAGVLMAVLLGIRVWQCRSIDPRKLLEPSACA